MKEKRFSGLLPMLPAVMLAGGLILSSGFVTVQAAGPGPEVCKACHTDKFESYSASIHGQKGNTRGPANAGGCVACHTTNGDATAHVNAGGGRGVGGIINPGSKSLPAEARSKVCLSCHEDNRNLAFWDSGKHKKNDVSCSNCHSIHGGNILKKTDPSISPYVTTTRQLQYETCASCHKDIRSQINKPSHHPIIEGKIKCSDCHNPHGALSKAMIKSESVNTLCTSCHTEKRGPFIHEHAPVEENCLTCHNVHGSQHNKLLSEKVPNLCENCHTVGRHNGTIYGSNSGFGGTAQNTRFLARSCVNCHNQIHGSNASTSGRGQFFVR